MFLFDRALRQCPWSLVKTPEVQAVLQWWDDYESKGILPPYAPEGARDLLDCPAFIVQAIRVCQDAGREVAAAKRTD